MGGSVILSEGYGEETNPLHLPGIETEFPGDGARSLVSIPSEFSLLGAHMNINYINPTNTKYNRNPFNNFGAKIYVQTN
jgi:hypothetical protein